VSPVRVMVRAVGLLGAVVGLLWAGAVPATAAASRAPVTLVLTEVTTGFVPVDVAPAGPSPGDSFTFTSDVLDPAGVTVGTIVGGSRVLSVLPSGRILSFIDETVTLADGTLRNFGPYDQTTYQAGGRVVVLSVGTGGGYRGKAGTLTAEGTGTFGVERLTVRLR
jgi:allene oxide cyclase-like protein